MQSQPVQFQLPIKGVVKGLGFSDHTPDAAIDALNVLPFDSTGRLRLSPRPGTAKLWAAALGVSQSIQFLMQTTIALDPSLITPSVNLINLSFGAVANGTFLQNIGGALTTWRSSSQNSSTYAGTETTNVAGNMVAQSGRIQGNAGGTGFIHNTYVPTLVIGTVYVIQVTAQWSAFSGLDQARLTIDTRTNKSTNVNTEGVSVHFRLASATSLIIDHYSAQGTLAKTQTVAVAATVATNYVCEVLVNGNVFTPRFNGVSYAPATITNNSANTGIGFGVYYTGAVYASVANFAVYTGTALASYRQTNLIAVCNGTVYMGDISTQGTATIAGTGGGTVTQSGRVSGAAIFGNVYLCDGFSNLKVLNIATRTVSDWVGTAGTETATTLGAYQIAAVYRGRLVLAADRLNPQNFVLSRVGLPTDFNYATTDTATAFAGNAAKAGQIGEPIVALMPFSDDIMLIGGDHNLWAVRGDPADGGSIDMVSDAIGMLGMNAWTKSPDGTIYFVGTGGLFRMSPGGSVPEPLSSEKVNEFFRAINRATQYVTLAWDRDRHQLFIFIAPINTGAAVSIVYDQRTEGFWPIAYPDSHGPLCAIVYDGDGPTDRTTLLGGRTGYIQQVTSAMNDDGTAISSYVYLGPVKTDDTTESVIDLIETVMGKSPTTDADWNCVIALLAGQTAEQAFTAPLHSRTKTQTASGRQGRWWPKIRGNTFFLKLSNAVLNKTWVFERASAQMTASSIIRRKA